MSDTAEIVAGLRRGDENALARLYERYGKAVYSVALRVTGQSSSAEEVTLDTFHQVWRQVDRFDEKLGSLHAWMFTIARTRAIDRVRASRAAKRTVREGDIDLVQAPRVPEELVELGERRRIVREALDELAPAQRAAIELAYFEDLSHSQIAERLGEPLGTIKTRLRSAMVVLRQALPVSSS